MKQSLRLNIVFKILLSICNIFIPLLVGPYIIRALSRTSYDLYTKASVEIQLFLTLATSAIYTYGIRSLSKLRDQKDKMKKQFFEIFFWELIFNAFFFFLYFLYTTFFNSHQNKAIYYVLMIQFVGSSLAVEWMNEALEDYRFITIKSLLVKGIYIAMIFIFVRGDNLISYGIVVSLAFVLENLFSFLYLIYKQGIKRKKLQLLNHIKGIFLAFLIVNISLLYVQTDKIMLASLISDSAVTTYTIPNYIVTSIYNVIISLFIVAIPRLNKLFTTKSYQEYHQLYNELSRAFLIIFIPILFYVFINSEAIIILYAAGKYNDCINPLKLYTIAIFFNALVFIQREGVLYILEKEKIIITYNLIGGLINLCSNFLLFALGLFNPTNAIITLIISYIIVAFLMKYQIKKNLSQDLHLISKPLFSYILFSLPIFLINYFLKKLSLSIINHLIFSLLIFIIIYLGFLFIFKDQVFLNNLKTSLTKIKGYLRRKNE